MSGYMFCSCRDCMDVAIGREGERALCLLCVDAGCEADNGECKREDVDYE